MSWLDHPPGLLGVASRFSEWASGKNTATAEEMKAYQEEFGVSDGYFRCARCNGEVPIGEKCPCKGEWDKAHGIKT